MSTRRSGNPSALALSLFRDLLTGQWFVCRIDMSFDNMTNQTLFNAAVPLEDAFCVSFVERMKSYLPRRPDAQVTTDARASFDCEGLSLTGIRVIAMKVMDGVQMVVVRFTSAVGTMTDILHPAYRPDTPVTAQDEDEPEHVTAYQPPTRVFPTQTELQHKRMPGGRI